MKHFIQYHNTNKIGVAPDARIDGFQVWTNKPEGVVDCAIDQTVWLISGEGRSLKKRYFFEYVFVADEVVCGAFTGFKNKLTGSKGFLCKPHIDIGSTAWFLKLKAERGNFGLGFGEIKDAKIIEELEALRKAHATPFKTS